MKKKTPLIFLLIGIVVFSFVYFNEEISRLFLYFDTQNINSVNNFFVTKDEIKSHRKDEQALLNVDSVRLDISLAMDEESISVEETIIFRVQHAVTPIFNFTDRLTISKIKLNGEKVEFENSSRFLRIEKVVRDSSEQKLQIYYSGKPEAGLNFYDKDSVKYLFSINEPIFAQDWFVCNDTPKDKFYFALTCSVDSEYSVISNGRKIFDETKGKNRTVKWQTSYPIATYLSAFYAGKYYGTRRKMSVGRKELTLEVFSYPEDISAANGILDLESEAIKRLERFYGSFPFVNDKFAVVEIPWKYGGIENQTSIGIGEDYFRSPEMFAELFVHETAHEWFGNCVGIRSWDDIWIDEGLANYSQALYWKETSEKAYNSTMLSMLNGALKEGKIRSRNKQLFNEIVYNKSAWIFRMLNYELGDSLFFQSIRKYISLYKYKTADARKLKSVFEEVSKKDLSRFFSQWVFSKSDFIQLSCNYNVTSDSSSVEFSVEQTSEKIYSFVLPVTYIKNGSAIGKENFNIFTRDTTIQINDLSCDSLLFDSDWTLLRGKIDDKTLF